MAGSFSTLYKAEVKIKLPELNVMAQIFAPFHVTSQKCNNNLIFFTTGIWNKSRFPKQLHWMVRNQDTHEIN